MSRVLVVDDEVQIRRALSLNLRARGYEVVETATGEQAIQAAASERPDLVLLDLGLPGLGGIQVIEAVRQKSDTYIYTNPLGAADCAAAVAAIDIADGPEGRERLANLATQAGVEGHALRVHAPLIRMSKAQIALEGQRLGLDFSRTVSCYQADAEGRACGRCDACRLRAEGFAAAGLPDPTRYAPRA